MESLDEQMKEKVDRRTLAAEEFLREKAEVDAVVAAIEAEDDREKEAREAKEYQIRKHIEAFVAEKEKFKHVHAEQLEAEKEEIRDYAKQVMARETVTRMAREKDQNTKDEILGKLSADMAKRQLEADEMENLRNELVIQETEERIIIKEEEKAEEDQFRRAMLDKFADDDRLDQLNEQKRRRKQMEHRKEIERLLEVRRAKFDEERANETEEQVQQEMADGVRMKIIVDERARILAAHAKNLDLKHLPKGVLATDADFAIFSQQ